MQVINWKIMRQRSVKRILRLRKKMIHQTTEHRNKQVRETDVNIRSHKLVPYICIIVTSEIFGG